MLIIGAGAAGLAAAITAARAGASVKILEKRKKAGSKIVASGNGRCNIGNRFIEPSRYRSRNSARAIAQMLAPAFGNDDTVAEFLQSIGVELVCKDEGKLYPMSENGASVVDLLLLECKRTGVEIVYEAQVETVSYRDNLFEIECLAGSFRDEVLLLCTGSPAAPQMGGGSSGPDIAASLGHSVSVPLPALVPLESGERWTAKAAGVKLYAKVELYADGSPVAEKEGDILFTDYGISGLAVLDISIEAVLRMADWQYCELRLDLMPGFDKNGLKRLLRQRVIESRNLPVDCWLSALLHRKIVPVILQKSNIKAKSEAELNDKDIAKLAYTIANLPLPLSCAREFRYAEVSLGGVSLDEVDPQTMRSKVRPNLYLAGEVLDIVGERGGYNLHFAWLSGIKAGLSAGREAITP